jgi:hypothetical protein
MSLDNQLNEFNQVQELNIPQTDPLGYPFIGTMVIGLIATGAIISNSELTVKRKILYGIIGLAVATRSFQLSRDPRCITTE